MFGFALLSYPFISNYIFEKSDGSTIRSYDKNVKTYDQKQKDKAFQEVKEYNEDLVRSAVQLTDPFKVTKSNGETFIYNNILNIDHTGVMGYLEIPCISVNLPVYHGTDAKILERGIGHLAASSMPVGGKSTHSVLTGHTGLSTAKLFTDLTEMKKRDLFYIHVLDRILAYKVDQISIVKPEDTEKLQIIKEKDYVTLVTCTPYGVNDHRLLVRGVRTKYRKEQQSSIRPRNKDSQWMRTYKKAIMIGLAIVIILILLSKTFQKLREKAKYAVKEKEMKTKLISLLGIILMGIGTFLFFSPDFSAYKQQKEADQEIEAFEKEKKIQKEKDPLYKEALQYDLKIYKEGQKNLKDVWSYRASPIKLKDGRNIFGYIRIKKMNVKLPLYLGATLENMRKGAVIMGETSLPLGTKNSNCVIAAHRGYQGIPYFREIEKLKVGDKVIIRNSWEKLTYRVEQIKIIKPDDSDQIRIQKGKDMVTLLTCHPYRGHGKFRYVVYCIRDKGQKISDQKIRTMDDTYFESSEWDIQREKMIRYIGFGILIFFGVKLIKTSKRKGGK